MRTMLRYQVRVVGVMEGQRAENWVVVSHHSDLFVKRTSM